MSDALPTAASRRGTSREAPAGVRALVGGLVLAAGASLVLVVWVLVAADGWAYYRTPLQVRGYAPAHAMLRPSGRLAHPLGVAGLGMILVPIAYSVRKKWRRLAHAGSLRAWLEVHIFCGVFGPVLLTCHTALKFNGIVSVAYWLLVAVVVSGFVGRYFYVRIPKTIRGVELTHGEILERAGDLKAELAEARLPQALVRRVEAFERAVVPATDTLAAGHLLFARTRMRRRLRGLRREIAAAGIEPALLHDQIALIAERAVLLRRLAYLDRTRRLFAWWHVFHQPLVYLMLVIAAMHIAVVWYLGYSPLS